MSSFSNISTLILSRRRTSPYTGRTRTPPAQRWSEPQAHSESWLRQPRGVTRRRDPQHGTVRTCSRARTGLVWLKGGLRACRLRIRRQKAMAMAVSAPLLASTRPPPALRTRRPHAPMRTVSGVLPARRNAALTSRAAFGGASYLSLSPVAKVRLNHSRREYSAQRHRSRGVRPAQKTSAPGSRYNRTNDGEEVMSVLTDSTHHRSESSAHREHSRSDGLDSSPRSR